MAPKTVHLVAACGTAMGTLAGILKSQGIRVTGSDQNVYPPMSTQLEKMGVELFTGYDPSHLSHKPDLVVIGNAVRRDNVEARAAIDGGYPYVSFTDALAQFFLEGKESVVIAGTHGKTTTTSLLSHLFIAAGRDPNLFVGGIAQNLGTSFYLGKGPLAFLEGDEYDTAFFDKTPKFWHYRVKHALITHVEYDHADIYENVEAVEAAFAKFITLIPKDGSLTACASAARLMRLVDAYKKSGGDAPIETYSVHTAADWTADKLDLHATGATFTAMHKGKALGEFTVPLVGTHNAENALGAIAVATRLGLSAAEIDSGLQSFTGVKRRMEERGTVRGITIVDDFAHHPTAVAATLQAAQQRYPKRRIIAVFEPRSQTSRRKIFQNDYEEAFSHATVAFFSTPFASDTLAKEELFDSEELAEGLRTRGVTAAALSDATAIVGEIAKIAREGDVVLVMSNGAFGGIHDKLLAALA